MGYMIGLPECGASKTSPLARENCLRVALANARHQQGQAEAWESVRALADSVNGGGSTVLIRCYPDGTMDLEQFATMQPCDVMAPYDKNAVVSRSTPRSIPLGDLTAGLASLAAEELTPGVIQTPQGRRLMEDDLVDCRRVLYDVGRKLDAAGDLGSVAVEVNRLLDRLHGRLDR